MRLTVWYRNGDIRTIDVVGPLKVVAHSGGTIDILHDEGTGWDYWFNKDGSFDGTGMSCHAESLDSDEAKMLLSAMKDLAEGRTKPFEQVETELRDKEKQN